MYMKLRFIYGRAGSGKTHFCLQEIKERVEKKVAYPLILLVPEQYTFQAERDLIRVLGSNGILHTEVLSFQRLAFRIFNQAGGITYPHIHAAGKSMMIYSIMDKLKKEMRVFSKAADRQGFVDTLSTLITEFKRYHISPEDLKASVEKLESNALLREKLAEITIIYAAFEDMIVQRYRDADDDLTLAANKIKETDLYDGAEIWIDEFAGFTPQEYKLIAALFPLVKQINIALCTDSLEEGLRGTDVFAAVKQVYLRLRRIGNESGVELKPPMHLDGKPLIRFEHSPALAHLECNLNAFPHQTYLQNAENLSLFSSVNLFAEVEAAAREIVGLCRDHKMRYRDIAVVTRNLENYERLIDVIFNDYEIPYFVDRKKDITHHPLVRLILSMLDIFNAQWSYEAVFRYLKTGLTGIDREKIDLIENYVLACGIRGNRWTKEEDWTMTPNFLPEEQESEHDMKTSQQMNQIRLEITKPLLVFQQKTKGRKKASEIGAALYDFLGCLGVPARIQTIIDGFQKNGQLELANEYGQVWNMVMDVLDQIVEVMGEETLGRERFSKILEIGFGEYQVGLIPASLDQVLVGSIERSKSHEIKALFILGVNDGVFPSSVLEEGILSDQDRAALSHLGIEMASDTRTQAFDEQYLVYRTLTTPKHYLRLSWPIADQEGKSMRPSIIISRLRKIFPKMEEKSDLLEPLSWEEEVKLVAGKYPSFNLLAKAIRKRAEGMDIDPVWPEVYHWFATQPEWESQCTSMRDAVFYRNAVQPVSAEKIFSLYGTPAYASVSRLERYTACPFAFYVQYGLGAKERKIYRLSPPDVGTFMHAVIERFSRYVEENEISWRAFDRQWCGEQVSLIVDEMLEKMKGAGLAGSKRYTALTLRLKRVITRAVWLIAEHIRRGNFEPLGYEMGFGEGEKFPPIVIELDSGHKINLVGRIDRVDALQTEEGTYLRIVDYKSGSKDFKLADVYYGIQIQLITYLDALAQNEGLGTDRPVLPGGILYFHIDDPMIKGNGKISEEEIELAIMKQLKMRGLLLADVKLIKQMDQNIEGSSVIIPARINKGDTLGRSSVASLQQFEILRTYVRKLLKGLCEEITNGNVSITPYKKKKLTSCTYCNYSAVCQFDTTLKENSYKRLDGFKDEEIWNRIDEKGGEV